MEYSQSHPQTSYQQLIMASPCKKAANTKKAESQPTLKKKQCVAAQPVENESNLQEEAGADANDDAEKVSAEIKKLTAAMKTHGQKMNEAGSFISSLCVLTNSKIEYMADFSNSIKNIEHSVQKSQRDIEEVKSILDIILKNLNLFNKTE